MSNLFYVIIMLLFVESLIIFGFYVLYNDIDLSLMALLFGLVGIPLGYWMGSI